MFGRGGKISDRDAETTFRSIGISSISGAGTVEDLMLVSFVVDTLVKSRTQNFMQTCTRNAREDRSLTKNFNKKDIIFLYFRK